MLTNSPAPPDPLPDSAAASPGVEPLPPAPVPRRLRRPRWLDPRILIGLLLVIAAVVIGAKVIGSSRQTTGMWAATHDLASGTVLTDTDLERVQVNLGGAADGYLAASASASGQVLNRAVTAGELIPVAALADPPTGGRLIGVGVPTENMPPGVTHGSVIDLYLLPSRSAAGGSTKTRLAAEAAVVQSVQSPAGGGLSAAASDRYQVVLLLPAADADALVRRLPTGEPFVVLRSAGPP